MTALLVVSSPSPLTEEEAAATTSRGQNAGRIGGAGRGPRIGGLRRQRPIDATLLAEDPAPEA